ncbi:MAG TPA: nitrilase-related carbon-nitrogen hydrolase [Opitutaceae bacterium]|nr:nitrilase-related carbon-nitrogen hydrolase [Opitutaceae bacterium]
MDSKPLRFPLLLAASLLTAVAYWNGTGLQPRWPLTWLAAMPVLLVAPRAPAWTALGAAFSAFALGALNTWSYLALLPLPVHLAMIFLPSLAFGLGVLAHRFFLRRRQLWPALLALPAIWTSYVYLLSLSSPHGTFGALAYTQADCLPILQLAALGGIWPIEFLLLFIPTAVAVAVGAGVPRREKIRMEAAVSAVVGAALIYGFFRLGAPPEGRPMSVGLIASDQPENLRTAESLPLLHRYLAQVPALAQAGARIVVLPEHLVRMADGENAGPVDLLLADAAVANKTGIVVGLDHIAGAGSAWNEARYYPPEKGPVATYTKHHLLPGLEGGFQPGRSLVGFSQDGVRFGLAICKDLDFRAPAADYGRLRINCLIVPAFDFSVDAWLHSRIAMVRGVESGYPIIRVAKLGALTVSDDRGRVRAEVRSAAAPFASLVAPIPGRSERTFYGRFGDWFAWLSVAAACALIIRLIRASLGTAAR